MLSTDSPLEASEFSSLGIDMEDSHSAIRHQHFDTVGNGIVISDGIGSQDATAGFTPDALDGLV
jgi:hypothetical protein